MIDLIHKLNPFRRMADTKRHEAIDKRLSKFEKVNERLDGRIIEKRNSLTRQAQELEKTVKEALDGYDGFRNH